MWVYIDISSKPEEPVDLTRVIPLAFYLAVEWAYPAERHIVTHREISEIPYSRPC